MSIRIERLTIRDFGALRALVLEPAGLTVVHGANETGKTTCIDALVRALRDQLKPGNRKLIEHVRDGAGFDGGEIDLRLDPPDGGSLAVLLREHPSLARLFIVRDSDTSLESGRGWLNAIRDRVIGIDLGKVADRVRVKAALTPGGALREARAEERARLMERLTRLDAFIADLPSVGSLAEQLTLFERRRLELRARAERLRTAERFQRYSLARQALARESAARDQIRALERYTQADLHLWRDALALVREAVTLAKSTESAMIAHRHELAQASEQLRLKEAQLEAARELAGECARRLEDDLASALVLRDSARTWRAWRTPISIASLLLLSVAIGLGRDALSHRPSPASLTIGLALGAAMLAGLATAIAAIYLTSRMQSAGAKRAAVLARCTEILAPAASLEECAALVQRSKTNLARSEAERAAAAESRRAQEAALEAAEATFREQREELERCERRTTEIRRRVDLSDSRKLEEKLREREHAESSLEHSRQTLASLVGASAGDIEFRAAVEALRADDPGIPADPTELHGTEDEIEALDAQLARVRAQLVERRDHQLAALGLANLAAVEQERTRLDAAIAAMDRETAAARICLQALGELAQDIDLPLRDALGTGPRAAGAYLSRLTGGAYRAVILDGEGKLSVERHDGAHLAADGLSHGARDQLALAVRLALVRRLLGEPAFLVLDDAFLSSDAVRREALVTALGEIVDEGWQIMYFTFDQTLRDRLVQAGAKAIDLVAQRRLVAVG